MSSAARQHMIPGLRAGALRVWIVRHGDRFDYEIGYERWNELAEQSCRKDPPLSDLGNLQASELAAAILKENKIRPERAVSRIITSPFLRCIETANPLANQTQLPLMCDWSLFELGCTSEILPLTQERARYFPRVDTAYTSVFKPSPTEGYGKEAIERYGQAAEELVARFPGESLVLVTHAAGVVSIVSKLLKLPIRQITPASPCCLFMLERETAESAWNLNPKYNGSISHLSSIGETVAWPRMTEDSESGCSKFIEAGDHATWLTLG